MLAKGYLERPIAVDETFLDALHRGFRSVWTSMPEEYPTPYSEEELERYGREVNRTQRGTMQLTSIRQAIRLMELNAPDNG